MTGEEKELITDITYLETSVCLCRDCDMILVIFSFLWSSWLFYCQTLSWLFFFKTSPPPTTPHKKSNGRSLIPCAIAWQNQQNDLCAQWSLRSVWASAQSDQRLRCVKDQTFTNIKLRLIRLRGCSGWPESSLGGHAILFLSCCGSFSFQFFPNPKHSIAHLISQS